MKEGFHGTLGTTLNPPLLIVSHWYKCDHVNIHNRGYATSSHPEALYRHTYNVNEGDYYIYGMYTFVGGKSSLGIYTILGQYNIIIIQKVSILYKRLGY